MKKILLPALIFCVLFSCRKHNDKPDHPGNTPEPPPAPAPKLRIRSVNGNTYAYDSIGRLSRLSYSNAFVARTDYTYTKTTVTATDFDRDGTAESTGIFTYTLAANGLATGYKYIIAPGVPALASSFTFNADRQLVEQVDGTEGEAPATRTIYYYSKGNMDSLKMYSLVTNKVVSFERFEYYTDRLNTVNNENTGIAFLGVASVNFLKKDVRVNDHATTVIEYTYEFDDQKRAVKSHMSVDGSNFSDLSYTYIEIP